MYVHEVWCELRGCAPPHIFTGLVVFFANTGQQPDSHPANPPPPPEVPSFFPPAPPLSVSLFLPFFMFSSISPLPRSWSKESADTSVDARSPLSALFIFQLGGGGGGGGEVPVEETEEGRAECFLPPPLSLLACLHLLPSPLSAR